MKGAEAPDRDGSGSELLSRKQPTPSQLRGEAMIELMTVRLAELVSPMLSDGSGQASSVPMLYLETKVTFLYVAKYLI